MRTALLLFVVFSAYITVSQQNAQLGIERKYGRYIPFPDEDGNVHVVDLEAEPDYVALAEILKEPAGDHYILYTNNNPKHGQYLVMNDSYSVQHSFYNKRLPTVVVVHGWLENRHSNINRVIRDAYLSTQLVNVIVVDWERLSHLDYVTAVHGVPTIGRGLGQFIKFLVKSTGAKLTDFHLIGFSLGAHVVGNAGRELQGGVARITGLDPAGPLWNFNENRINRYDALYVEAIHTDAGFLGIGTTVGQNDFFVNDGTSQPGCLTVICNHIRSWQVFAVTVVIPNHLIGRECSDFFQIKLNICIGKLMPMGNADLSKTGLGMYRVNTNSKYPY